jgi:uncharacterized protein (TIGR03435 family)
MVTPYSLILHAGPVHIVMKHRRNPMCRMAIGAALLFAGSLAQTALSEQPQFETASIHPTGAMEIDGPSGCLTTIGLMRCTNVTLKRCVVGAYRVGPDLVQGGPDWINTDRFQITARSDQPVGDKGLMAMLQGLLADRFKLVLHRESRRRDAMILQVGQNGPRLRPADGARPSWSNMHDHLEATNITMGDFAGILSRNLGLPVVDHTGLTGSFSFTLRWNPDDTEPLQHDEAAAALRPEMSRAISRQLGLTLESQKIPVDILVIDHVEKPSEN